MTTHIDQLHPRTQFVDPETGLLTVQGYRFLTQSYERSGGPNDRLGFDRADNQILRSDGIDDLQGSTAIIDDSGNMTVNGNGSLTGNLDTNGTGNIDGNTTLGGTLGVTGATTLNGATTVDDTLKVTGAVDFDTTANVDGNTTLGGTLGVTGAATFSSTVGTGDLTATGFLKTTTKINIGSQTIEYGSAAPVSGTYIAGDIVLNTAPVGGTRSVGWICTTGGTPGTWNAFGDITA